MKYILMMSGSKAGVDGYRAWSKKDIDAHMDVLRSLNRELAESGEFVATQRLAAPHEAKTVRGLKEGMPITDGIFPESKEFLLGYWIIDVAAAGACLRNCRPPFSRAGSRRSTDQHADRSPSDADRRFGIVEAAPSSEPDQGDL